jgi:hypothetical protein
MHPLTPATTKMTADATISWILTLLDDRLTTCWIELTLPSSQRLAPNSELPPICQQFN